MSLNEIPNSVYGLKKSIKNIPVLTEVNYKVKTGGGFALPCSNSTG
jgi:hypothetical protein